MKLRLIRIGLTLLGNALGLLLASIFIDDVSVSGTAFVIAVVIFTVLTLLLEPLVSRIAQGNLEVLASGSALITTAAALLLTAAISDGLSIDGIGAWLLATIIVWLATALIGIVLVKLFVKEAVAGR